MGIRGLTSFLLEDAVLAELCASKPYEGEGDARTCQRRKGERKKEEDARERTVVLVDALSCFFSFFQKADSKIQFETRERKKKKEREYKEKGEEDEDEERDQPSAIAFRLLLSDYGEFCAWVCNIHLAFAENGFEMRYYFDNIDPASDPFYRDKFKTRLRRKKQWIKSLRHIEKVLSKGSIHPAKWQRIQSDLKQFVPVLALDQLLGTLKSLGATIVQ